jgi:hypothetical protein
LALGGSVAQLPNAARLLHVSNSNPLEPTVSPYWDIVGDIGIALWGACAVIAAAGWWWVRAKEFERERLRHEDTSREGGEILARVARIERIVEAIAFQAENIAEAQRFASKLPAERATSAFPDRHPERIITPH